MAREKLTANWRTKVNPFFVLSLQFIRTIPRILRELSQGHEIGGPQLRSVLLDACDESKQLLPTGSSDHSEEGEKLATQLLNQRDNKWFADPEVRKAAAHVAARLHSAPQSLLTKGFERPHWWMMENSWEQFIRKGHIAESFLNALALLQTNMPLRDLVQQVGSGNLGLYAKLFRPKAAERYKEETTLDSILEPLKDQATKIVGTALLIKGQPPGYQLHLRMVLFFGWEFGLRDLSIPELHRFLTETHVVPDSYDPETLRKYRNRLRETIEGKSRKKNITPFPQ